MPMPSRVATTIWASAASESPSRASPRRGLIGLLGLREDALLPELADEERPPVRRAPQSPHEHRLDVA